MSQTTHPLSSEERKRRRAAVDYARASVELEGFVLPLEERILAERYVNGEIELDEYVAMPCDAGRPPDQS